MQRPSQWLMAWLASAALVASAAAESRPPEPATQRARAAEVGVAALAAALRGEDVNAAVRAAAALAESEAPGAVDALLDALALGLHPMVAAAALDAVGAHADVRAYEVIAFFLRYRDPRVRRAAVGAVGALDDPRSAAHVLAALRDGDPGVRAAAMEVIARRDLRRGIEPMIALLQMGDQAAAPALATMADADVVRALGEVIGAAPHAVLARTLGAALARPDFGPERARVRAVRILGKLPGAEATAQLEAYVASVPATPPRQSRREAAALVARRTRGQPR